MWDSMFSYDQRHIYVYIDTSHPSFRHHCDARSWRVAKFLHEIVLKKD